MDLLSFSGGDQETRLVRHNDTVYKLKLVLEQHHCPPTCTLCDIDEVVRAVIYRIIHDRQPIIIKTKHFIVTYTVKLWRTDEVLMFRQYDKCLSVCSNIICLYFHSQNKLIKAGRQLCAPSSDIVTTEISSSHRSLISSGFISKHNSPNTTDVMSMQQKLSSKENIILPGGCLSGSPSHIGINERERVSCKQQNTQQTLTIAKRYLSSMKRYFMFERQHSLQKVKDCALLSNAVVGRRGRKSSTILLDQLKKSNESQKKVKSTRVGEQSTLAVAANLSSGLKNDSTQAHVAKLSYGNLLSHLQKVGKNLHKSKQINFDHDISSCHQRSHLHSSSRRIDAGSNCSVTNRIMKYFLRDVAHADYAEENRLCHLIKVDLLVNKKKERKFTGGRPHRHERFHQKDRHDVEFVDTQEELKLQAFARMN